MLRIRRAVILAIVASMVFAMTSVPVGATEPCNKFNSEEKFIEKFGGDNSPQPGEDANDVAHKYVWVVDPSQPGGGIWEPAVPKGHQKDINEIENDPGASAHDKDETEEKPGERVGHCKYDPHATSDDPPDKDEDNNNEGPA